MLKKKKNNKTSSASKQNPKQKKKKTGKIVAIAAGAVVLIGGGIFASMKFSGGGSDADAVYVQKVGDLMGFGANTVTRFSGIVENQKAEKIEVDTSKVIKKIYVEEGDEVKKGDKLFVYSVESMELDLEQGNIEIERLQNTLDSNASQMAELEKEKANASSTGDRLSIDAQIQQLKADNNSTEYDIKVKKSELKQLKKSIKNATVKSPIDGVVKTVSDSKGLDEQEEAVLMTIQAGNDIHIKGKVNEVNIGEIYVDQPVVVRSRINADETWDGKITQIVTDKTSENENEAMMYDYGNGADRASSYDFFVDLDSIDNLMMGQHITIEPDLGQTDGSKEGIWLSSGYFMIDENEKATVWKDNGRGRLEEEEVTLGEYDEMMDEYEVLEGLTMEDLIAWPDERCKSGARTTDTMIWNEDMGGDMMDEDMMGGDMMDEGMMGGDMMDEGMMGEEMMDEAYDEDFEEESFEDEIDYAPSEEAEEY